MILAIIQARMNSTRLPGKVMMNILGKPVIWRIYERLKFSKKIDKICICTSTNSSDDIIANYAEKNNLLYHRGSEEDLISRHLGAAKKFNADILVRVTGDDPLVDPEIIDKLIVLLKNNKETDFVSNTKTHTYPIGLDVEVFPTKTLEKFIEKRNNKIFYEYFISGYIFEHPDEFHSIGLEQKNPNLLRWTLDYLEDYDFINKIYFHLYKNKKIFLQNDIELLLKQKPELKKINEMHYNEFSHLKYKQEFDK
jgi:spore coat polysaccharide biosynthesis protein SpsF